MTYPKKPAAELERGDYTWFDGAWREVRHVEPCEPIPGQVRPRVAIIVKGGKSYTEVATDPMRMATDAEIAQAQAVGKRASVAAGLRALADQFASLPLPVPHWGLNASGQLASEAELRFLAGALGLSVNESSGSSRVLSVDWQYPAGAKSYESFVEMHLIAYPDKEETSAEVSTPPATAQEGTPAQSGDPAATGSPDTPKPGEVETGQGTAERDPSARDSASPAFDPRPKNSPAGMSDSAARDWYAQHATSLDQSTPGWYRDVDPGILLAPELADEVRKRWAADASPLRVSRQRKGR